MRNIKICHPRVSGDLIRIKKTIIVLALCLTLPVTLIARDFFSASAYAQQAIIRDKQGRERGYSRTQGDVTYNYTKNGRQIGYSKNVGDRTYDFDRQGRERGYSQTVGDAEYHYNKSGRERGYSQTTGTGSSRDPGDSSANSSARSAENQMIPFAPSESSLWGYSNAGASKPDKPEDK
ncbi:MAG: hypothetical protein HQ594_02820 [Candidatus Omnitrophica bacterium]|nr:hypothetical protein [Candidatus Omnitrophota bacterium]